MQINNKIEKTIKLGDFNKDVLKVQLLLSELGFYKKYCDGNFNQDLLLAIVEFQKKYLVTEEVSPKLFQFMVSLNENIKEKNNITSKINKNLNIYEHDLYYKNETDRDKDKIKNIVIMSCGFSSYKTAHSNFVSKTPKFIPHFYIDKTGKIHNYLNIFKITNIVFSDLDLHNIYVCLENPGRIIFKDNMYYFEDVLNDLNNKEKYIYDTRIHTNLIQKENEYWAEYTIEQFNKCIMLTKELKKQLNISLILKRSEIDTTLDPGPAFEFKKFIEEVENVETRTI